MPGGRQGEPVMRLDSSFEPSPISDELLGRLYRAGPQGAGDLITGLPALTRAAIAVFCHSRAHLHEIGLAIAATCDQPSLSEAAGKAGHVLYAQSRNRSKTPDTAPVTRKRAITLATFVPIRPWTVIEGGL